MTRSRTQRVASETEVPRVRSLRERLREAKVDAPAFPEFADLPEYPPTMTFAAIERLLELVSTGNYLDTACAVTGLAPSKVHRWIRIGEGTEEGKEQTEPFISFVEVYNQALAIGESRIVEAWNAEALTDYRAGMSLLARRHPERWGKQREEQAPEKAVQSIHVHIGTREASDLSFDLPLVSENEV